jgi:hypothetical protein
MAPRLSEVDAVAMACPTASREPLRCTAVGEVALLRTTVDSRTSVETAGQAVAALERRLRLSQRMVPMEPMVSAVAEAVVLVLEDWVEVVAEV